MVLNIIKKKILLKILIYYIFIKISITNFKNIIIIILLILRLVYKYLKNL